jgi:Lytic transglycolase
MINVINVPPVLESQVHYPVIATQATTAAPFSGTSLSLDALIEDRSIDLGSPPIALELADRPELAFSTLLSSISIAEAPQGQVVHPAPKATASLHQVVTLLQPRNIIPESDVDHAALVKKISLWSAGVSHDLRFDPPLLTVLKAENPRSVPAAPTSAQAIDSAAGSHPASSASSGMGAGAEASVVEKEVENKGDSVRAASSPVPEIGARSCLAAEEMLPKAAFPNVFQVQVKGHPIAYLPTQAAAETLERQIKQLLQAPKFDPNTLRPAIVNGVPVGKAADAILFEITPDLAASFDRNSTLLAIAWINQLRITMGAAPLALAEAQSQMYHLLPSDKQIEGNVSWYDPSFEGSPTATGETFDSSDLTAAHPTLPFGTYLKVTNQQTADSVIVRVNDRGPYLNNRSLDVSGEAAHCLNSQTAGVVPFQAVIMEASQSQADQAATQRSDPEASQQSNAAP